MFHARIPESFRAVLPVVVVMIMVAGGFIAIVSSPAGPSPASPAPISAAIGAATLSPETGSQLAAGPYLTNPSTPTATLANGTIQGATAAATPSQFTVGFALQNSTELTQILSEQATPGSPMFHHWLTLSQEEKMFGPNPVVVTDTINYFTSLGFHVETQGPLSISFKGTAGEADQAFRTNLVNVQNATGAVAAVNSAPLALPSAIALSVSTVNGLNGQADQFTVQHFQNPLLAPAAAPSSSVGAGSAAASPLVSPAAPPGANVTNISALYNFSNHAFGWVYYYSQFAHKYEKFQFITPGSLSLMYQALPMVNAGYNGAGTTIAIVMGGGINPDDLRTYASEVWNNPNQIWNRLTAIPVDGAYGLNGTLFYTDGASNEMALDIEYSSTMAPAAHITAVYGPGLYTTVLDDDYAALAALPTAPNIVSNSWGGEEDTFGSYYGNSWDNAVTMHSYIMLLTARGTTVLASSADGGGFDPSTGMLSGSYPATDPYVLAVNGVRTAAAGPDGNPYPTNPTIGWTNASLAPGVVGENFEIRISRATQTLYNSYWYAPFANTTLYNEPPQASGGFGTSMWFQQGWWQHGPFMPNIGRSLGSGVAAEADFNQSIFFDGNWEFLYGGTSFACPTTAGMLALTESYLAAQGEGSYLGNGNIVTALVGNAWFNHNITLAPYSDVLNGTSFWGNIGVSHDWSWPPGQVYPIAPSGPTYGNTTVGWDFPTGWGVINVWNFAHDIATLYGLPGQFATVNAAGTSWSPATWGSLTLNSVYSFHVNATSAIQSTNPAVTLVFVGSSGGKYSWQPTLLPGGALASGYMFVIDTAAAQFTSPGYLYLEFGNSANPTLGFGYTWIAEAIATSGTLKVTVVTPSSSTPYYGGDTMFNAYLGWIGNVYDYPNGIGQPYTDTFTVLVTDNGAPVYNAVVTASIPTWNDLAFQGSLAAQRLAYHGLLGSAQNLNTISYSFTNTSGDALVQTANVNTATNFSVTATYGTLSANTTYQILPMPNVKPVDGNGGNYSQFNLVKYLLSYYRLPTTEQYQNLFTANSVNQSDYYSMLYAWQGQEMPVTVNDYTGASMPNMNVWLANYDIGHLTRFVNYEPTLGAVGITNVTGTANVTNSTGGTTIYIPNNQTAPIGFNFGAGPYAGKYAGLDFLAVSLPGMQNRTFQYSEPCFPPNPPPPGVPVPPLSCMYNNSFQRNYTTVPVVVFPDPISVQTMTRAGAVHDFFNLGSNLSWSVFVKLPNNNPFVTGPGTNWNPGTEHVVSVNAYVDGVPAGNLTPTSENHQIWNVTGNLTGTYAPGIHTLLVVVRDSEGHIFTQKHVFIVGSVTINDLTPSNVYSAMPFNLTWSTDIPASEVSNKTFNMSLEMQYITNGCSGRSCPLVVNLSIPIHPGIVSWNQSINRSLLAKDGFYSGAGDFPPGQYSLIIWLNANHSGSVQQSAVTYLVFDPLTAQINGPSANALVPAGNLTISYSYNGQYIESATLSVYQKGLAVPVYQVGAFIPGIGSRGGSSTWTSVTPDAYELALNVSTPYENLTSVEWINVSSASARIFINGTGGQQPLFNLPSVATATILVLVAAIIGLLLGALIAAPIRSAVRRDPSSKSVPTKPWQEKSSGPGAAAGGAATAGSTAAEGGTTCAICHEKFQTEFALSQHAKITHGMED
ncbi:MAG: S53 family peptidase [Thermoplasmata archaeon]